MLFVLPILGRGGAERVATLMLRHLDPEQFAVAAALFERDGSFDGDIPDYVEVFDLQKTTRWDYPRAVWRLVSVIRRWRPDVLYGLMWQANALVLTAASLAQVPGKIVLGVRNLPSAQLASMPNGRWHELIVRRLYRHADLVLANSVAAVRDLTRRFGLPDRLVKSLPNPVDLRAVEDAARQPVPPVLAGSRGETSQRPYLVTVGRLVEQKDHALLVDAYHVLRQSLDCTLVLVGTGPLEGALKRQVVSLGLELDRDVLFLGWQSNPYAIMRGADAFVLSSAYEGLPNVVLEAMACGVPVIATRVAGVTEVIHEGVDGLMVIPNDPGALSRAIGRVLCEPELAKQLRARGIEQAKTFAVDAVVAEYERLFRDLITDGEPSGQGRRTAPGWE